MGKIIVIYNPKAHLNRRDPKKPGRLARLIGRYGEVEETRSEEEVEAHAKWCRDHDVDIVAICGGDGTYQSTLTKFMKVYGEKPLPAFALLRGGTMNNIGRTLGIDPSSEKSVQVLMKKYKNGRNFRFREPTILDVNGEYGFIFGTGVISTFLESYYKEKHRGPIGAASLFTKAVLSAIVGGGFARKLTEALPLEVTLDQRPLPLDRYTVLAVCTVKHLGFGFKPLYRAEERPGFFHLLGADISASAMAANLPRCYLGRPWRAKRKVDEIGRHLTIRSEQPICYTIDGELFEDDTIEITTGRKLKVVVG